MKLKVICAWCGKFMGTKEGGNSTKEITHSICCECSKKLKNEAEEYLKSANETDN